MKSLAMVILLGLVTTAGAAQIYEWVDEKGVKQYTQQPPPPNIKNVRQRQFGGNVVETKAPAHNLQQAVENHPVLLYATDCGEPCTKGRAHLVKRGIPFTEKDPLKEEEFDNFKKLSGGSMGVPLLVVGELRTLKGFLASDWDAALDKAGYPGAAAPGAKPVAGTPPAGK